MPPLAALLVAAGSSRPPPSSLAAWCFERLAAAHWSPAARARGEPVVRGRRRVDARRRAARVRRRPGAGARRAARGRGAGTRWPAPRSARRRRSRARSPAAFLVLACAAWWLADRAARAARDRGGRRSSPGCSSSLAFPQGGIQPFTASRRSPGRSASRSRCSWPSRATSARCGSAPALYARRAGRRRGASTPRSAATSCGSRRCSAARCAAGALWDRRRTVLCVLALPLLYWQWLAPVRSVLRASGDPSSSAAYHAPLIAELDRRAAAEGPFRTEIPFTAQPLGDALRPADAPARTRLGAPARREAQRPLLRRRAAHAGAATARWLDDARRPLRRAARRRARPGGRGGGPRSWRRGASRACARCGARDDWRLYRVEGARPLATPPARVTALGLAQRRPDDAAAGHDGRARALHAVLGARRADAAASAARPGDWTRVRLDAAGPARLAIRFAPGRIRATGAALHGLTGPRLTTAGRDVKIL